MVIKVTLILTDVRGKKISWSQGGEGMGGWEGHRTLAWTMAPSGGHIQDHSALNRLDPNPLPKTN